MHGLPRKFASIVAVSLAAAVPAAAERRDAFVTTGEDDEQRR